MFQPLRCLLFRECPPSPSLFHHRLCPKLLFLRSPLYHGPELLGAHENSTTAHLLSCISPCRSRTRGPIGPGKYGYGKAPYILPLQTDSAHSPQRLRRQRPSPQHSRSQGASGPSRGYSPPARQASQRGPLYQRDSGPRSGLQASEASIYQLPLTHAHSFPAASSLFRSPETSSNHGMGAHRATLSFSQPARSAAISCTGAYRQYKMCNTNVSTLLFLWAWYCCHSSLPVSWQQMCGRQQEWFFRPY